MRVLVTGATGLVAGRLCQLVERTGHTLISQSRGKGFTEQRDLRDSYEVAMLLEKNTPDVVINASGMTDVDACHKDPIEAYAANVVAVRNLSLACRNYKAHLVHLSTDYVFDGEAGPYREDATPTPRGVYARTKHEGEIEALARGFTIARTAVVYGWPPASGRLNFGAWLVTKLKANERVRLFSDQLISPTWAGNAAAMILELALRGDGGIWHCSGAEVVDRVSFGRKLCEVFGFDASLIDAVPMADVPMPVPRPKKAGLLIGKANTLEEKPLPLDESLRAFHAEVNGSPVVWP